MKRPSARHSRRTRIFVISEHAIYREALRTLLEVQGDFRVVGMAADCVEAVEPVRRIGSDVVLLDLGAPVLPDTDTLRRFASACTPARIILVAPAIARPVVADALRNGVRGIVLKAARADLLPKSIRTVMSGQYWIERAMVTDLVETLFGSRRERSMHAGDGRFGLTNRELQMVSLLVSGSTNRQIADKCAIGQRTVKHHLTNIFEKLGVSNRLEVVLFALQHRLVKTEAVPQTPQPRPAAIGLSSDPASRPSGPFKSAPPNR